MPSQKSNLQMIEALRRRPLWIILAVSVVLRVGGALYLGNVVVDLPGTFDQISYHNLAVRVTSGYGFTFDRMWWPITPAGEPTAHWSYLYTLYLVFIYKIFGINPIVARLIQAVIVGLLHPLLAYRLGERIFGQKVGLLAAGATGIYIYFVYYAGSLMTEAFYITGILASLWYAINLAQGLQRAKMRDAAALSLSLGLTVLLRQLFLLIVPFLFLWIWWAHFQRSRKIPLKETVAVGLILAGIILPVTAYNYAKFDQFVLLNTNAGYAFFWGNHPVYGTNFESILPTSMGSYQELIPEEVRHLDEAALDRELLRRGIGFVTEDPWRYVLLSISRIPGYFTFWPSAESGLISNVSRVFSFGLFLPFMLYGLWVDLRERAASRKDGWRAGLASPQTLILGFAFLYTVIHLLTWTLIRYRLPVDAVVLLFAGVAITRLFGKRKENDVRAKLSRMR